MIGKSHLRKFQCLELSRPAPNLQAEACTPTHSGSVGVQPSGCRAATATGFLAILLALPLLAAGPVDDATMQRVYETVKTPHKVGVVLRGPKNVFVDCPSVFRRGTNWYMTYITFDQVGYDTWIASSTNLLDWTPLGKILTRGSGGWDDQQVAGYTALQDTRWDGSWELQTHDGKFWMSYIGGALKGYETDPLAIGVAWTYDPVRVREWNRIPNNPVLSKDQPDCRAFEKTTQFKSNIIRDPDRSLGREFVMFYNARAKHGYETIGIAVSDDLQHWQRYGDGPVIDNGKGISGDPQVVRMGDVWVMFYFGAFYRPGAFDTFAVSRDLAHWTKWTGPDLIAPSEPWDKQYAHKPWVVQHEGVVYHFYCAVGDQSRVIGLATSRKVR